MNCIREFSVFPDVFFPSNDSKSDIVIAFTGRVTERNQTSEAHTHTRHNGLESKRKTNIGQVVGL